MIILYVVNFCAHKIRTPCIGPKGVKKASIDSMLKHKN